MCCSSSGGSADSSATRTSASSASATTAVTAMSATSNHSRSAPVPESIGSEPLTVYLSLNYLAEQGLSVGSRLPFKVLPERMRFF